MAESEDPSVQRDLKTLIRFIEVYCHGHHDGRPRQAAPMRGCDVAAIAGAAVELCPDCRKLLMHALVKRIHCPMDPKPACKHCPNHCYHPDYRSKIREVMAYSGRRLVLKGRLDYLLHLLF
jgi:hypothetical protein